MHVAILGAGALGSILAAHLARSGQDVTLLARGDRARHIVDNGVKVTGLADFTTHVRVLTDPSALTSADLLILTVKTYDTRPALGGVAHARVASAFSVQNGLDKDDALAAVFGPSAVIGAAADFSGQVLADGAARFTRNEGLYLGELPSGLSSRVGDIAAMLCDAGIDTRPEEHILTVEWSKLSAWLALSSAALLTRLETHRLFRDPGAGRLQAGLYAECRRLTDALAIELRDLSPLVSARSLSDSPVEGVIEHLRKHGAEMQAAGNLTHKMSALQDLERHRRLELEETYGYTLRRAHEAGVAMPVLEACYNVAKALDRAATS